MAFEVNITPEDIDSLVKDAILKAGIGNAIQKVLSESLTGYNSPVTEQVKRYVGELCSDIIRVKYQDQIKAAVAKAVEERITPEIINTTVDKAMEKIVRAAEDRY